MTGRQGYSWLVLVILVGCSLNLPCCDAKISDLRKCYDEKCSEVISLGRTTVPYPSRDQDVLSFPGNVEVKVFSKHAGKRDDLWGVEIQGKRGYAPKSFIREYKVLHGESKLNHIVPTEDVLNVIPPTKNNQEAHSKNVQDNVNEFKRTEKVDTIAPHKVTPRYETIDGTVIPIPQDDEVYQQPLPSYSTKTVPEEKSAETLEGKTAENLEEKPVETLGKERTENSEEEPAETSEEKPAENSEVKPADNSEEKSAENLEEKPAEKSKEISEEKPPEISEEEPQEISEEKPVEILQESTKPEEEEVKLEAYPNIISSMISGLNSILGSEDESEDDSVELSSSEKIEDEDVTQKTPEIEKVDESSLTPEKQSEEFKTENLILEDLAEITQEEILNPESSEDHSPDEVGVVPDAEQENVEEAKVDEYKKIDETNSRKIEAISAKEINLLESKSVDKVDEATDSVLKSDEIANFKDSGSINEKIIPAADPTLKSEQPIDEIKSSDDKEETVNASESKESTLNVETIIKSEENNLELADLIQSQSTRVDESLHSVVYSEESSKGKVVEEAIITPQELQNHSVPKQEDTVFVTVSPDIVTETPITENAPSVAEDSISEIINATLESKQVVDAIETPVNVSNGEESIKFEVPLKENFEQPAAVLGESFVPNENLNLPSNNSLPIEKNIEINENLTSPDATQPIEGGVLTHEEKLNLGDKIVDSNNNIVIENSYTGNIPANSQSNYSAEGAETAHQPIDSSPENIVNIPASPSFGEFLGNRNLLNAEKVSDEIQVDEIVIDQSIHSIPAALKEEDPEKLAEETLTVEETATANNNVEKIVLPPETCERNTECGSDTKHQYHAEENAVTSARKMADNSETLMYVCITAVTTLLFSLGYYFLENRRRDEYLIKKINKLEQDLMITKKECITLDESFKSAKSKLDLIENESFGSNDMVLSLKAELAASENNRAELEEQIISLEKELESTSEAGLELERMLREILASQNEENNPLAQSIEDLQVRLNDQQVANESLTKALEVKSHENKTLTRDLTATLERVELLQSEVHRLSEELRIETTTKLQVEQTLSDKVQKLELQVKTISENKASLKKQLRTKELELKELLGIVDQLNSNSLDYDKLYDVSKLKAEISHLVEERDELKSKLTEEEGAHQLLEEHVKVVTEEVATLSELCRTAEREKQEAENKLDVLKTFFKEEEDKLKKEREIFLEKLGESKSTVQLINDYEEQIKMLRREIVEQEAVLKSQIKALESKADEHWVAARQAERRLEEVKAESSQLRNRLTLVEKNMNETDPETKLHRLQHQHHQVSQNGESGAPPPPMPLFPGGETSTSPLMFAGGGPPPPYMFGPPPPPPFLPLPPSEQLVSGSRPAPLGGGRLSSPPPPASSNPASPPPHHPGHIMPPFPMHLFASDPHMPPPHHMPPPPLPHMTHSRAEPPSWDDPSVLPHGGPYRTSAFQRPARNHKGSLHSSGESLDKSHHGKV